MAAPKEGREPKANRDKNANLDLDPNAWPKFEALVKNAAKMGHKPHKKEKANRKRPTA
jgi:hypothetical protein